MTQPNPNLGHSAAQIFKKNHRINQLLIEHLDPALWQAKPPGNTRPIAAIFSHMHNVRCKWIRLTAPHLNIPKQLNRATCTPERAEAALSESAAICAQMLAEALEGGSIKVFRRDALAKPWPPSHEMLCYMLTHEAHHRGQICMLAHQLGYRLPPRVTSRMWNWEKF